MAGAESGIIYVGTVWRVGAGGYGTTKIVEQLLFLTDNKHMSIPFRLKI